MRRCAMCPPSREIGVKIELNINAGLIVDLPHLHDSGADGIGLYRTELQFMMAQRFPRLTSQIRHYSHHHRAGAGKPVTFRTLDIGADKILPYLRQPKEENPALGWRSIRMALDRPALLRLQLRALMLAAEGAPLKVMFPMIADVDEYKRAIEVVEIEKSLSAEARTQAAPAAEARRDDRDPVAHLAARPSAAAGRLRLHRVERSGAVPLRVRPRQSQARGPL